MSIPPTPTDLPIPVAAPARPPRFQQGAFTWLLVGVSVAFALVLWPLWDAVLWGAIIAMVFHGLNDRIVVRLGGRPNLAALITLLLVVLIVILPLLTMGASLVQEAARLVARVQAADQGVAALLEKAVSALPRPLVELMERHGLADLAGIQRRISASAGQLSQAIATRLLGIGQDTLNFVLSFFVTLYLAFFLLRDGRQVVRLLTAAIPIKPAHKRELLDKFVVVTRATVKGNVVVAAVQGLLGGLAFWVLGVHAALLWGVVMAVLSLLPAVGTALVWLPVAVYLMFTGALAKGIGLVVYGVVVIGLVDNVLRPLLVGKDTRMPDYVVLISTVGGMALFGINGFVLGPLIAAMFIAAWGIVADDNLRAERALEGAPVPDQVLPDSTEGPDSSERA
jgi:predicted PurR-regulated permease PerM